MTRLIASTELLLRKANRLIAECNEEVDRARVVRAELNLDRAKSFRRLSPVESMLYVERARSAIVGLDPVVTVAIRRRADRVRRELEEIACGVSNT